MRCSTSPPAAATPRSPPHASAPGRGRRLCPGAARAGRAQGARPRATTSGSSRATQRRFLTRTPIRRRDHDLRRRCSRRTTDRAAAELLRVTVRAAHRRRELDPRGLHRPDVQDRRQARPAARGRGLADPVGHRVPPGEIFGGGISSLSVTERTFTWRLPRRRRSWTPSAPGTARRSRRSPPSATPARAGRALDLGTAADLVALATRTTGSATPTPSAGRPAVLPRAARRGRPEHRSGCRRGRHQPRLRRGEAGPSRDGTPASVRVGAATSRWPPTPSTRSPRTRTAWPEVLGWK